MAPPSATATETHTTSPSKPGMTASSEPADDDVPTPEPGVSPDDAKVKMRVPAPPRFADKYEEREYLKGRLAAAFRLFAKCGFDEGVAGHITLRDPVDPTTFWVNPFGVAFALMRRRDLIQVDHDGRVVAGGPSRLLNAAAYMIHAAVHRARPDVVCAAHSHSLYGRSYCALAKPLDIITQDSCAFWNDHVVYRSFKGVVLAEEEGRNIAAALGGKKAALLMNHGLLTVGPTVEAAVFWFLSLDKCCHAQLLADAAAAGTGGATAKIADEDAAATYKAVGTPRAGWFSAKPLFDVIHRETGGEYLE